MKKILTLIFGIVLFTGCCVDNNTPLNNTSKMPMLIEPMLFQFNGHEYIYFYTYSGDIILIVLVIKRMIRNFKFISKTLY